MLTVTDLHPWTALEGFLLGAGLIIAIGAQNAFVLRQGLLKQHVLPLVLMCATIDAILIAVGSAGFGSLVRSNPILLLIVGLGGAAFLFTYAGLAFRRAAYPQAMAVEQSGGATLHKVLATGAAFTILNPHVYLDTVVLAGGLAGRYPVPERIWFAGGAALASFVWFSALGYGARILIPLFARPIAWRILDASIGLVMVGLGTNLLRATITAH